MEDYESKPYRIETNTSDLKIEEVNIIVQREIEKVIK